MNIAIVGAGLMGRLVALSLLRGDQLQGSQLKEKQLSQKQSENVAITLFDKDNKLAHNSAAYAAAGLLTPLGESLHCEPNIVKMGFESLRLWPVLLDSLDEYTFFQQTGAIMVSHEQDKGDYQRFVRHLNHNYPQHTLHTLNRAELLALEPEIGRSFNQGLYLPQEGQIGNRRLLVALRKQLEQEGQRKLNWLSDCLVTKINTSEGSSAKVRYLYQGNNHHQAFDLVIDCRGTGATLKNAKETCAPLADLRSVRGELFQLFAPNVNISRPIRLMHPRYQLYIAPKGKGFYVVGATEIESDDISSMTVRSAMELLSAAYSVHIGQEDLANTDLEQIQQAGLRLGISTHGCYEFLLAQQLQPSYLAVGAIFPTKTKDMTGQIQGINNLKQLLALRKKYPKLIDLKDDEQRSGQQDSSDMIPIVAIALSERQKF